MLPVGGRVVPGGSVDADELRGLIRHMALNAFTHQSCSAKLHREFALPGLMALKAFARHLRQVTLRLVHIVASRAGHSRARAETFTSTQQRNLISVDIGG